jgi:exodeoxyribonuclease VII small subunit
MGNEDNKNLQLTFEEAVKELEAIINSLEAGDVTLEDSLELFKRGISLAALCNEKLTEAQGVVKLLYKERTGELQEAPFDAEEKELR